jgi:hypothetical protein
MHWCGLMMFKLTRIIEVWDNIVIESSRKSKQKYLSKPRQVFGIIKKHSMIQI